MRFMLLLSALIVTVSCASRPCQISTLNSNAVRSWLDGEHRPQEELPYSAEYQRCGKRLIYVAARHTNDPDSRTFRLIERVFDHYRIDAVIVEGFPSARGTSPARMADYARSVAGTARDAEPYAAIRLALVGGAAFRGGEPTDAEVLRAISKYGITAPDLFAFYVLRRIPQWKREERITGPADPALENLIRESAEIFASNVGIPVNALAAVSTLEGLKTWYAANNGLPYDDGYRPEDVFPYPKLGRRTNSIAARVGDARERAIISVIDSVLANHNTILVVYGGSHHVMHAPALEAAFGPPTIGHTQ